MRAVVQRVSRASVTVDGTVVGEIGRGLTVLLGVAEGDGADDALTVADKVLGMRIFPDDEGRMNRSVVDIAGSVMVISQFTLIADLHKGRRPSFSAAARPEVAEPLVERVLASIGAAGVPTAGGRFGAHMLVDLVNDGPVTIVLEVAGGRIV